MKGHSVRGNWSKSVLTDKWKFEFVHQVFDYKNG